MRVKRAPAENPDWEKYFVYLDDLRVTGGTDMYGAGPYLANAFSLDKILAISILEAWMKAFGGLSRNMRFITTDEINEQCVRVDECAKTIADVVRWLRLTVSRLQPDGQTALSDAVATMLKVYADNLESGEWKKELRHDRLF